MTNRVRVSVAYGDLWSEVVADGVSYAPDAVNDMMAQCVRGFSAAVEELRLHGVIKTWEDFEESEELESLQALEDEDAPDE